MKKILVVVDMQNDFVDGALGTPEAEAILPAVVQEIQAGGYDRIFVTLDTHAKDYLETLEGQKLPVPHCIKNTHGWELTSTVAAALAGRCYTPVEKPTFGSLALAQALCAEQDAAITFIGLCTDICVASNAIMLRAYAPNLPIRVICRACAGTTPEKHAAALATMASCQIDLVSGAQ